MNRADLGKTGVNKPLQRKSALIADFVTSVDRAVVINNMQMISSQC